MLFVGDFAVYNGPEHSTGVSNTPMSKKAGCVHLMETTGALGKIRVLEKLHPGTSPSATDSEFDVNEPATSIT